jgi:hypothetical protein
MAKKKLPKMTAEELAQREETQRMVEERIAYHEAKAVEKGEITPEVARRRTETQRMVEERIAYHAAKAPKKKNPSSKSAA